MSTLAAPSPVSAKTSAPAEAVPAWTAAQRFWFRVAFIFIPLLTLPLQWSWYERLTGISSFLDAIQRFSLGTRGIAWFTINSESGRWGLASFSNWAGAFLIALAGAAVWTLLARNSKRREYNTLLYWLRLFVRYWIALNVMHYGLMKLFPRQMPFPSTTNLATMLGDHALYRTYWQIIGVVTWYQVMLGLVEVVASLLLFFRRTVPLGATINFGVLLHVAHANIAYDGSVHVYSGLIALLSAFLLLPYLPDLWRLLIKGEDVRPRRFHPVLRKGWRRTTFIGIKTAAIFVFGVCFIVLRYDLHYNSTFSKEPRGAGLPGAHGRYEVTEFKLNGEVLPYSPLDPVRWHEAVFEDYPTFTYRVNRAFPIRLENGAPTYADSDKIYELAGFAGGWRYFHYEIDEENQTLRLSDRTRTPARAGQSRGGANSVPAGPQLVLKYERPTPTRIVLSGLDEEKNEIQVVLDRAAPFLPIHIQKPVEGEPLHYEPFKRRYPLPPAAATSAPTGRT